MSTVKKLALLPTRDEGLSMFLGYLNSLLSGFAGVLEARKVQLEEGAPAPAAAEPAAAPAEAPAEAAPAADAGTDTNPQASA